METDLRLDFYLYTRTPKKGRPVWYVKFRDPVSRKILPGVSSRLTSEPRARDWARKEYTRRTGKARTPKTVREFASPFYSEDCPYVKKQRVIKGMSEKTRAQKRRYVESFILTCDELMDRPLEGITRKDLERFRDDYLIGERFEDPCRTSQAIMEVVKTIFGQAVEMGLVLANPVYRLPTGKYDAIPRVALSEEALDGLLKREHYGTDRQYRATMVAATTGMRAGEVRGLQWGDLDPKAGIIRIDRAMGDSSTAGLPKWGKRRVCPYPGVLRKILEPIREKDGAFVFAWEDGTLNYRRWKDAFYRACDLAGVDTTLHGLRHTLNTALLMRGIPDAVIRAALGWSDPKIQGRYTHISFGEQYHSPIIDSVEEAIRGETRSDRRDRQGPGRVRRSHRGPARG